MTLPKITKEWVLSELSKVSLILAFLAGIPYTVGEAANVLPPAVKAYATGWLGGLALATKLTQYAIMFVTHFWGTGATPDPTNPLK